MVGVADGGVELGEVRGLLGHDARRTVQEAAEEVQVERDRHGWRLLIGLGSAQRNHAVPAARRVVVTADRDGGGACCFDSRPDPGG
ncbi:hypothetical protein GCM10010507_17610 [Streptomyces cinnamoneus]|uniref:Uncharacterized protein n=1 Tax=Streptomyces cinnamoneus TaxID=53446 RepID=A0A918WFA6_STRCJ|nr:hypothetical protein GCM10010507_17610 [Streptomyces cinnamoneus]